MNNHVHHGLSRRGISQFENEFDPCGTPEQGLGVGVASQPWPDFEKAGVRAVVVNDCPETVTAISRFLFVYSKIDVVGEALDGYEALEAVGRLRPELVIMDLHMPRMNGLDATEQLRRMFPSICIVMTSTDDGPDIAGLCQEYGADAIVATSRLGRNLLPEVERAIAHRALQG